jgi:CheY-like chemotaxis protein
MKQKKVELVPSEQPLLLVVDSSLVFLRILQAALRRAACDVEIVAFQEAAMADAWLSGTAKEQQNVAYPFASPWDKYPEVRPPTIAIVSLGLPIDERDVVMDRLFVLSRETKIITTSTQEELLHQASHWDEGYWRHVVSHLPKPIRCEDVIERVITALHT